MKLCLRTSLDSRILESLRKEIPTLEPISDESLDIKSIVIQEIKSEDDIKQLKSFNAKKVCLIHDGTYMFECLDLNPIAFIRISNLEEDLKKLSRILRFHHQGLQTTIEFKSGYETVRLNVENIIYIESYAHYLMIHTKTMNLKVREKISKALERLKPFGFIQIHKSYLINKHYLVSYDSSEVQLKNHICLPIGSKYKNLSV